MAAYTIPSNSNTTFLGNIDNAVEILLEKRADYYLHENSMFWKKLVSDRSAVKDQWSRNYIVHKIFRTGIAGIVEFPSAGFGYKNSDASALTAAFAADSTTVTNGPLGQAGTATRNGNFGIFGTGVLNTWPGPATSPNPGVFGYSFGLRKGIGNFHIPLELLQYEQEPSVQASILDRVIDGNAEGLAQLKCNAFMGESAYITTTATAYKVTLNNVIAKATVLTAGAANPGSNAICAYQLQLASGDAGSIARLCDGQRVDVYIASTAAEDKLANTNWIANAAATPWYIQSVDGFNNSFWIVKTTGTTVTAGNTFVVGNKCLVTAHKAYNGDATAGLTTLSGAIASDTTINSNLPFSLEDMIKSSGLLLGDNTGADGIPIAQHPWAKGYKLDLGGSALDRTTLLRIMARVTHGRNSAFRPDLWVFSEGSYAAWMESIDGMVVYQMNGQKFDESNTGFGETIGFNSFGFKFDVDCDRHIGSGKCYGVISRNNNFKMHTPRRLPGAGTMASHGEVDFLGKAIGLGSNMIPVLSSSEFTNMVQAPYQFYYQIVPDFLGGMIQLSNVGESYSALA